MLALKKLLENICPKNEAKLTQKPINAEQGEIENEITSHNNSRYDDWKAWQNNFDRIWNRAFQHIQ